MLSVISCVVFLFLFHFYIQEASLHLCKHWPKRPYFVTVSEVFVWGRAPGMLWGLALGNLNSAGSTRCVKTKQPNKQNDPTCKTHPKFLTVSGWDVSVGTRLDVILLQRVQLLHSWVILIKDLSGLLTFRHCAGADIRCHAAAGGVGRVVTGMDLDLVAGEVAQVGDDGGFLGMDSDHSLCAFKGLPVLIHWDVCALRRAWGSGEKGVRSVGDAHHSASLPRASRQGKFKVIKFTFLCFSGCSRNCWVDRLKIKLSTPDKFKKTHNWAKCKTIWWCMRL